MRWLGLAVLVLVPYLGFAQPLAAAEAPSAGLVGSAREHYEQGAAAYAAGRYERAVTEFLAADRLAPRPALSYNVARAYDKLGNVGRALEYYRDYLRRAPQAANTAEISTRVRTLEAALASQGMQQISVRTEPSQARVRIDESWVGSSPWTGELRVGAHRLRIVLDGYGEHERAFELDGARTTEIEVKLEPVVPDGAAADAAQAAPSAGQVSQPAASAAATSQKTTPTPETPARSTRSTSGAPVTTAGLGPWPWISLGVGAAALVGSLGFELSRRSVADEARGEVHRDYLDRVDEAEARETTARVLLGVGSVLAITGGVLLYLDRERSDTAALSCGPSLCLARVESRF